MPLTLVFDVNETLLDLAPLRPGFERLFGDPGLIGEWFARMLHGSLVANHIGAFRPFGTIGVEALMTMASKRGLDLAPAAADTLVGTMRDLPPHPDVAEGLQRLRRLGHRTVTLTNGAPDFAADQIRHANLSHLFDHQFTVAASGRFKPAPEPYLDTLDRLGIAPTDAMMVAAHDWDIAGARAVGMHVAFVNRPGAVWSLPGEPPELAPSDINRLADALTMEASDR